MNTIEFESYITQNCIQIPLKYTIIKDTKVKVCLQFPEDVAIGNYNKAALLLAFENIKGNKIFDNITDSSAWQSELRDDWE